MVRHLVATAPRWRPTLGQVATGLVLLPLVVSAIDLIFGVGGRYLATSDRAGLELLAGDVGHHNPLIGPFSRDGWHHPGPMIYYLMALPLRLAGHRSIGLSLGALAINAASVAGVAFLAKRRGGTPMLLCTLVVAALLLRSLGAEFLRDPWNPYIVVLPLLLLAFLTWSMACGDRWALPVAVAAASFVVQTHIGYAALALPLLAWGVAWVVAIALRRRETADLLRPVLVAAAVAGGLWLPVLVEQWVETPGNLSRIQDYFADPPEALNSFGDGGRVVLGEFRASPEWLTGAIPPHPFTGEPRVLGSLPLPVLLLPFAAAAAALWRWRPTGGRELLGVTAVLVVAGVVSVARTVGPLYTYRLRWAWVVGTLAGLVVLRGLWEAGRRFGGEAVVRRLPSAALAALVLLSAVSSFAAVEADAPEPQARSTTLRAVVPSIERRLPPGEGVVVLRADSFAASAYLPGIIRRLERRGVSCRILVESLGEHRRLDAEPVRQRLVVAADADVDALGGRPGLELIAYHGRLSYAERRARLEALAEVAPAARLEATAALGPAVAVFAEEPAP